MAQAMQACLGAGVAVLAAAFLLVPVAVAAVLSFDARSFAGPFPPPSLSLRWYRAFFDDPAYLAGLWNSLRVTAVAVAISTFAGTAAAFGLARGAVPGRQAWEVALLSPKFVPTVVIGLGLLGLFARLRVEDGFARLVAGHVIITLPVVVRAVAASVLAVRPSALEAAESLGAGPGRAAWDVMLPASRAGVVAGALMAFVLSFDEVAVSLFLSDPDTQTLPLALVAQMQSNLNLTIAAASTAYVAVAAGALLLLDRAVGIDRVIGGGLYR